MEPVNCKGVETKFLGPTNHRPARVSVRDLDTKKRRVVSWDDGLGVFENHKAAAELVLGFQVDFFVNDRAGGYIFGLDRKKTYV